MFSTSSPTAAVLTTSTLSKCPRGNACDSKIPKWTDYTSSNKPIAELLKAGSGFIFRCTRLDDGQRAQLVLENKETMQAVKRYLNKCAKALEKSCCSCGQTKDIDLAINNCTAASQAFSQKQFALAWKKFNHSLAYAPAGTQIEAFATAGRAKAAFYIKQYENAAQDIDSALELHRNLELPSEKISELLTFKALLSVVLAEEPTSVLAQAEVLYQANRPAKVTVEERKEDWDGWMAILLPESTVIDERFEMTLIKDQQFVIEYLEDEYIGQETITELSDQVEVKYDETKKLRYLIAATNIEPDTIITISAPYTSVTDIRTKVFLESCHHCYLELPPETFIDDINFPRIANPTFCPNCANVIYCSVDCRDEAAGSYHKYECRQMAILCKLTGPMHLALKTLYRAGSMAKIRQAIDGVDLKIFTGPIDYGHVWALPIAWVDPHKLAQMVVGASLLTQLAVDSGFVRDNLAERTFACSLLLRHLQQFTSNAQEVILAAEFGNPLSLNVLAIYPTRSLMQHDCHFNVADANIYPWDNIKQEYIRSMRSTRSIRRGERLLMNHRDDRVLATFDAQQRQSYYVGSFHPGREIPKEKYCNCETCKVENPSGGRGPYWPLRCTLACSGLMTRGSLDEDFTCTICGNVLSPTRMLEQYRRIETLEEQINAKIAKLDNRHHLLRCAKSNLQPFEGIYALDDLIHSQLAPLVIPQALVLADRLTALRQLYLNYRNAYLKQSGHDEADGVLRELYTRMWNASEERYAILEAVWGPASYVVEGEVNRILNMFGAFRGRAEFSAMHSRLDEYDRRYRQYQSAGAEMIKKMEELRI